MIRVLLIDDSEEFREIISLALTERDYDVRVASCPHEGFVLLAREIPDVVICDLHMPFTLGEERSFYPYSYEVGLRTIEELRTALPSTPIIAVTATMPHDLGEMRPRLHPVPILSKPFSPSLLTDAIESALSTARHVAH